MTIYPQSLLAGEGAAVGTEDRRRRDAVATMPRWASLDEAIKGYAGSKPDAFAVVEPSGRLSWTAYDGYITLLAEALVEAGIGPGERGGGWVPGGGGGPP